ncbi:chemotaxis protein CheD [Marinibacterium profundimaris]|uniref:chemotaxis protein CheD n=1 Tax=Marinibacterium profundimaris TaxID=1679460 RepID=UPI000B521FDF|nr:chemotaxis protein CheD [Marinibacterium profundimaris]
MSMQPREELVHVIQGQFRIADKPNQILSTLLGSCVAACMRDPVLGIGGMNHFLLPGNDPNSTNNVKYGAHSMEQLVNGLLRRGALRERIEAQLFGGANIVAGLTKIGDSNCLFARQFMRDEGFRLVREDLGGTRGRKIRFKPSTGQVLVEPIDALAADTATRSPARKLPNVKSGEVDLF